MNKLLWAFLLVGVVGVPLRGLETKVRGPNPFVDPEGYKRELDLVEGVFRSVLQEQQQAAGVIRQASSDRGTGAAGVNDIEQGKKLFQGMCVTCHGFEGAGGDAPPLNRPKLTRAPDDAALRSVIGEGIPNAGMPRIRRLTENELQQLVSYVKSLGQTQSAAAPGNAQKGSEIYRRLACASCHIVNGEGGSFGPALSDIGRMRGPQYLRQAIVEPAAALPRGTLAVPARGLSEFLPVLAVTRDGREVRGVRLNEDTFTIQLRDASGTFYSFRKSELEHLEKQTGKSLMPSFANRLTAPELDDLMAYLSSLRGAQ